MKFAGINEISLVDFDNYIATTLFVEGYNLNCVFCHNSQLLKRNNKRISWQNIKCFLKNKKIKLMQ